MVELADLALFHRPSCGYCQRVYFVLRELGIEIEMRDISRDADALQELRTNTGGSTVPVLRIRNADGSYRFMPESADIMDFLREQT